MKETIETEHLHAPCTILAGFPLCLHLQAKSICEGPQSVSFLNYKLIYTMTFLKTNRLGLFILIHFLKMCINNEDLAEQFIRKKFIQLQLKKQSYHNHIFRINIKEKFKPL